MSFKSFYFLHVPRTGGKFVKKYLIEPIYKDLESKGIEIIQNPIFREDNRLNDHVGWNSKISPDTYVFSIFREPISWACSYFTQEIYWRHGATDPKSGISKDSIEIKKEELIDFYQTYRFMHNYQSQNFILTALQGSMMKWEAISFEKTGAEINKDFVEKRLNRVNLLVKNKDLNNPNKIIEQISSDMGLEIDYRVSDSIDMSYNGNTASKSLYDSLNNSERLFLEDAFSIDLEMYNKDIFWSTE